MDPDSARELLEESPAIWREVGCPRGKAQVLYQYALLRMATGDFEPLAGSCPGCVRGPRSKVAARPLAQLDSEQAAAFARVRREQPLIAARGRPGVAAASTGDLQSTTLSS